MTGYVKRANDIAERVLLPDASEVDISGTIPRRHYEELANAGLYGVIGALGVADLASIAEAVISGCLSTGFVWVQHHAVVAATEGAASDRIIELSKALRAGVITAGVSYSGLSSHGRTLRAHRTSSGYRLTGSSAFVTGWGLVDVMGLWAYNEESDQYTMFLVERPETIETVVVKRIPLLAAQASSTVSVRWDLELGPESVITSAPDAGSLTAGSAGIRLSASIALGVCAAAVRELESLATGNDSVYPAAESARAGLDNLRSEFDAAIDDSDLLYRLRADADLLAVRLAATVTAAVGSRAIMSDSTAGRLMREAQFCVVCATRPEVRSEILGRVSIGV